MPHVIVKLHTGRTEEQKARLAEELAQAVKTALGSKDESISVAVEEVPPAEWMERVYQPDIAGKPATIYRKPGYGPT